MQKARAKGLFDEEFRQNKIATKDPLVILSTKISWEQFRKTLEESFPEVDRSKGGRPAYDRLLMFKILILQEYFGLSDDQIEFQILDRLSFQKFIGQGLQDNVPDAKTIWLYRDNLTQAGVIDKLFLQVNKQLESHGLIMKKGSMVDASFAKVPIQRNTPEENEQLKNGETPDWYENKMRQKDTDAEWTKKGGQSHYGYKQHIKADVGSKLITNFEVTTASVHDSQVIDELINESDFDKPIFADSAYYSEERIENLKAKGIKPKILSRGSRNKQLTELEQKRNRKLSSTRCRVEHIFAWMKQKAGPMVRAIGITRVTAKLTLRIICYNLSRAVFLIKNKKKIACI